MVVTGVRTQKVRASRVVAAASAGVIAGLMLVGAALGADVEDITVTRGQTVEKDYGPLVANEPAPPPGVPWNNFFRRPNQCRGSSAAFCDVIDLNIVVPPDQSSSDFFKIDIDLTWTNPPTGANDLNLYLHLDDGNQTQALASASTNPAERVSLQDPAQRKYFIVVSNFRGVNTGYHLRVSYVVQEAFSFSEVPDDPESERRQPSGSEPLDEGASDFGFSDLPLAAQPEGVGAVGPRPVEQPGPDGSLSRQPLVVLAASTPPAPNSRLPLIVSSAVAFLAAAGLGLFLYLRGRHDAEF